jgi:hypothetical protein
MAERLQTLFAAESSVCGEVTVVEQLCPLIVPPLLLLVDIR